MILLRTASESDCRDILDIYAPYITDTPVTFETEVPSHAEFLERMLGILRFFPYLIAEENGETVGYAYAHFQHERAAYRWNAELSVYLKRGCERRGIGSALYRALMELLRLQGFIRVFGVITIPNDPSVALHERFGFRRAALYPSMGYKFGGWHDVAWYEKLLTPIPAEPAEIVPFAALDPALVRRVLDGEAAV